MIKTSIRAISITFMIIFVLLSCFSFFVAGQSEIVFTPNDNFDIPNNNSSISFAVNGICEKASLKNNTWNFSNLYLSNARNEEKLTLKVSAKNCKIAITSYFIYNSSFTGEITKRARLRYDIVGNGIQVFDLGLDPKMGHWEVIFDDVYIAENRGWNISSDGMLTVTGATSSVSLSYFGIPNSDVNKSFLNQHSVSTIITIVTIVVVIVSIVIRLNKKKQSKSI